MTFQQLKYLLEVYNTGSITAAAQNLYLAQSSLSIAISNLEQELDCQIFNRTKNGMIPTPQGLKVINRATRICAEYQLMTKEPQASCRRITFSGSNYEPVQNAYLRLIEENKANKGIIFTIESSPWEEAIERVALYETEVAVLLCHEPRILEMETTIKSQNLHYSIVGKTPVVATIGPGHRLYKQDNIDYRELESDVLVDTGHGTQLYNNFMKGIMHLDPDRTLLVDNQHLRRSMIAEGLAYSIGVEMPKIITKTYNYRYVPLGDLNFLVLVVTNPNRPLCAESQRFLALLTEELMARENEKKAVQ